MDIKDLDFIKLYNYFKLLLLDPDFGIEDSIENNPDFKDIINFINNNLNFNIIISWPFLVDWDSSYYLKHYKNFMKNFHHRFIFYSFFIIFSAKILFFFQINNKLNEEEFNIILIIFINKIIYFKKKKKIFFLQLILLYK
jgi:hypothetical protein